MTDQPSSRLARIKQSISLRGSCFNLFALTVILIMIGAAALQAFNPESAGEEILSAEEYYQLGLRDFENELYESALAHFRSAIEVERSHSGAHFYAGRIYLLRESFDSALRELDKAERES